MGEELLQRYEGNPILTHEDVPFLCNAVYNPGAAKVGNKYVLLPRVEDGKRDNRLHVAWSDNGIDFTIEPEPIALPFSEEHAPWEKHLYDPRITLLEGWHYVTYCAQTMGELFRIGLFRTKEFKTFERFPYITQPWTRNCALFPEKIKGQYARFDRTMMGDEVLNFVSYSPDLIHWGNSQLIEITTQTWFRNKWGCGPAPIKTSDGWLMIFHGVWQAIAPVYRLGVALLDLDEPHRVVAQYPNFIMTPRKVYERVGEVNNCVFCNGAVVEDNGEIKVYYGAADTSICLAYGTIKSLVSACLEYA